MSSTEQKNKTIERRKRIESRLSEKFEQLYVNDCLCFRKPDGQIFSLCTFLNDGAIVIEYADNYDEALKTCFEDGDLFYLEDMDEDTMLENMLLEIEQ